MDIKQVWGSVKPAPAISDIDLYAITHRKSTGILHKLKRKILIEEIVNVLLMLGVVALIFYHQNWLLGFGAATLATASILYFNRIYEKIRQISYREDTLHFLEHIHENLEDFIRMYAWGNYVLGAIGFIAGLYIGDHIDDNDTMSYPVYFLVIVVAAYPTYLFLNWMVHLMYGRDLKKIEKLLHSLRENA